jgi:hypothetical protein
MVSPRISRPCPAGRNGDTSHSSLELLDRLINDPNIPLEPHKVWDLLEEVACAGGLTLPGESQLDRPMRVCLRQQGGSMPPAVTGGSDNFGTMDPGAGSIVESGPAATDHAAFCGLNRDDDHPATGRYVRTTVSR